MTQKKYSVQIEIAGPTAMWTRPDTGDCPVSYPLPTYSAIKGIFESILWGPAIKIVPTRIDICSPIIYHNYHTNYGGPLRQTKSVQDGSSFQMLATVLIDVCYRVYADIYPVGQTNSPIPLNAANWDKKTTSPGHAYASIFNRRIERGQCYTIPFLGWKEFSPNYWGKFRHQTQIQQEINLTLPSILREVFSDGYASSPQFTYDQNFEINQGVAFFTSKGGIIC